MKTFEKASIWVRHSPLLEQARWLWDPVRQWAGKNCYGEIMARIAD
jgi:hypothetical protein